ncbi:glycosyl transferase family 1, partial [Pyxidicoccus sp. 3LFB2]
APPPPASVELVCPGFTLRPDDAMSRLARSLAERLPGARILALRERGAAPSLVLGPEEVGGVPVWHFTPDQPPQRESGVLPGASSLETAVRGPPAPVALPGASSLETAVRVSSAPVVLLGADTLAAQAVLPHVKERTWGVYESSLPGSLLEPARQQLGSRMVMLDASRPDDALRAMLSALPSSTGVSRAT